MTRSTKRLCYYLNSWTYGGVEEHVVLLCSRLPKLGYQPIVVCSGVEALRPLHQRLDALGIKWYPLETPPSPIGKLKFVRDFFRLLRRERITVLHVQLIYSEGGRLPVIAGNLARLPIVVTHHCPPREAHGRLQVALRNPFLLGVRRFIAVSRANQADHERLMRLPAERLMTIHNGIEVAPNPPDRNAAHRELTAQLGVGDRARLIGAVGRLTAQKGFHRAIDAMPAVLEQVPDAILVFVGDGPLKAELEAQAARLGVERSVHWMGFRKDVPALLAGLDVLVMPSEFEGLPLVLLEAIAAGCPAVARAVDGIPEVIDDGSDGFLIPRDAPEELLPRRVILLLTDPQLAHRVSQAARAKAMASFSVDRMVDDCVRLYDTVSEQT